MCETGTKACEDKIGVKKTRATMRHVQCSAGELSTYGTTRRVDLELSPARSLE